MTRYTTENGWCLKWDHFTLLMTKINKNLYLPLSYPGVSLSGTAISGEILGIRLTSDWGSKIKDLA